MNMRKMKMVTLVLLCVLTAGLCGIFAYGMSGRGIYIGDQSYESYGADPKLVFEKEIPLDGIDTILVQYDMNNNDIYLYEGEKDVLTIREYNELDLKEGDLSTVTVTDNKVEVRGKRRNGKEFQVKLGRFGFRSVIGYTEVILPASYKGQLSLLTASGDIKRETAVVLDRGFRAETSSGDIMLPEITAENVSLKCVSGDIQVTSVKAGSSDLAGKISIATSSGDIDVDQLTGEMDIESTSGEITLKNLAGGTKIKSSSGGIESEVITGNTWLETTSGDVTVQRIDGDVRAESSSGNIRILAGGGARTVGTTSGEIRLEDTAGAWEARSSSGDVSIRAQEGSGSITTTSGDIDLELGKLTGSLDIDSSSGWAKIRISADNAFDFRADTSSGDIGTFFDDDLNFSRKGDSARGTYGDNKAGSSIVVRTTSGDVQVTEKR